MPRGSTPRRSRRSSSGNGAASGFERRNVELIDFVDGPSRQFRWWHSGLHRLDFSALDARPLWDAIMLPLLAGVALVCGLGVWMGVRRLRRRERARPGPAVRGAPPPARD